MHGGDILNALILLSNFVLIPAAAYGSQLALGALGVTLVYGILRFSNFAHTEIMALGTSVTILGVWGLQSAGISLDPLPTALLAIPLSMLLTTLVCLVIDRGVWRYYRQVKTTPLLLMIVSIGVMLFLGGLVRLIMGGDDHIFADGARFVFSAREFKHVTGMSEGMSLKQSQAITLLITLIAVIALFLFLKYTRLGKAMRAYSDNETLALLSGVNPERVVMVTWIFAAILASLAGSLYGLDKSFKPFIYAQLLLPIFAAAIVGGIGSPLGAVAGGFLIAFSEVTLTFAYKKFLGYLLPASLAPDSLLQLLSTEYKFAVSFVIMVVVLLIRPRGIFQGRVL